MPEGELRSDTTQPTGRTLTHSAARAQSSSRSYLLPVTLLALLLRLIVAFVVAKTSSAQSLFSQTSELGCLATSVLHGHGLSSPFCGDTGPSAFLAPGYPLFFAAVFRVFGPYTMPSAACIVFMQALFGAATVPVTIWAARRAFGTRVATLAGLLCAVNPWLIGLEAVLWETCLSILLMTVLVGLAIALQQEPTRRLRYTAVLVLALAFSVNPSLVLTGVALLVAAAILSQKRSYKQWAAPALLFFALCAIWPARNFRALHAFVPLRTNVGYELWQGNRPGADGFFDETLHPNVNAHEYQRYESLGELAYMREKSQLAKSWIKAHPARFSILALKRAACFWFGIRRERSVLLIISTALLSLAGIASLIALFRKDRKLAIVFAIPLLLLPLPYYITHPDFRFWCLLAPTLTILTAWWSTTLWDNYKSRRKLLTY